MSLVTDCLSLVINGFVADSDTSPGGNGIVYTVQDIAGWWDSPSMRQETKEVPPKGEVVTVSRVNGRALVVTMTAHTPDGTTPLGAALCWTAIGEVQAAFACVYVPATMDVADPLNDQSAAVRLVGSIKKQILGESVAVQFQIPLLAPDPTFF